VKLICNNCGVVFESGESCICKDISDRKWVSHIETKPLESKKIGKIPVTPTKRGNKDGSNRE